MLSKIGLRGTDPDVGQFVRTLVVLAAVAALIATTGRVHDLGRLSARTWMFLGLAGLATAASWICYFRALAVGDASRVAAVDKLSVPLVAVIAALAIGEQLGVLGWLGVALASARGRAGQPGSLSFAAIPAGG